MWQTVVRESGMRSIDERRRPARHPRTGSQPRPGRAPCRPALRELDAGVIRIEDRGGDENRNWLPVLDGRGADFMPVYRGKAAAWTLNLKTPGGQHVLEAPIRRAGVLIGSFPPETARRLGRQGALTDGFGRQRRPTASTMRFGPACPAPPAPAPTPVPAPRCRSPVAMRRGSPSSRPAPRSAPGGGMPSSLSWCRLAGASRQTAHFPAISAYRRYRPSPRLTRSRTSLAVPRRKSRRRPRPRRLEHFR